ncbi:MAG: squalene/phytoene synthase family protein [Akkermansiaceae bacterium]|nr:squalene/phytoene synthase family protein [Akkermansiaceae bacterium]
MTDATAITRQAKSNLAFALRILPKERRESAVVFYAFCRVVDDLADDLGIPLEDRERALDAWKEGLQKGFTDPGPLEGEVIALRDRWSIPGELLVAIVEGCQMDLRPQRFESWEELSGYTWRVACAVGLVAMRIFGAKEEASSRYAEALGHALQITNILRDVGEDWRNGGRIYLPMEELRAAGYSEDDLDKGVVDERFLTVMKSMARRAEDYFETARGCLPVGDKEAMVAAEIMRSIYSSLLEKMRRDGFRVFDRRYSLSKARKMAIFSRHLISVGFSVE